MRFGAYREFGFNVALVAFFSVYTIGTLWLSDTLLARFLSGYVFSGNYKIGILIFFISMLGYVQLASWRKWNNWRYYIFGPIAVFFPLVFIASAVKTFYGSTTVLMETFAVLYCESGYASYLCGKAFAAVVTSMSLRALPAVLTVPALGYFLIISRQTRLVG